MAPSPDELAAQIEAEAKATLWALAFAIPSVKALVPLALDLEAGIYLTWRGLFEVALTKYALDDQVMPPPEDTGSMVTDAAWRRRDALVRSAPSRRHYRPW